MPAAYWRAQALVDATEKSQLEGMALCARREQLALQQRMHDGSHAPAWEQACDALRHCVARNRQWWTLERRGLRSHAERGNDQMRWPLPAAVAILIWGIASFAIVPPLQMRVMEAAKDAPNLASAVNIGAFNFGNAIGAALGGAVINAGMGYPAISLAGAAMAGVGLLMVLGFAWRSRAVAAVA